MVRRRVALAGRYSAIRVYGCVPCMRIIRGDWFMPTYEYLCQACSHRFETWQKMTDEPLSICPECGGHIRRVLYPTGVIFKGSGFYKTDHSNKSTLSSSNNGDSAKTESAKSDSTKASESTSSENGTSAAKTTTSSENKTARAAAS